MRRAVGNITVSAHRSEDGAAYAATFLSLAYLLRKRSELGAHLARGGVCWHTPNRLLVHARYGCVDAKTALGRPYPVERDGFMSAA